LVDHVQEHLTIFRENLQASGFMAMQKDGIEAWRGNLEVEWLDQSTKTRKIADHNIEIRLEEGFPYRPPKVISIDVNPPLGPSFHLNPDGGLCLWGVDRGWKPYFGANHLLNRIREWFHHYHTQTWPSNSEVPDLYLYLEPVGMILLGDEWQYAKKECQGRFSLWRPETLSLHKPCIASRVEGDVTSSTKTPESRLYDHFRVELKIKEIGIWFFIETPFVPPNNLTDLLGSIDKAIGWTNNETREHIIHCIGEQSRSAGFPIALGYKDNTSQERWLFLWAEFPKYDNKRFKWSKPDNIKKVQLKSFRTLPASKESLLRRSKYMSQELQDKSVTIFGCGSLGSAIALLLAKAGIGKLTLIDSDFVSPGNVARHICDLGLVGLPKTTASRFVIQRHVPDCAVMEYGEIWNSEKIREYLSFTNLVIDATANRSFSLFLNDICIETDTSFITATAYRKATIGRIVICRPKIDPCLACYSDHTYWNENQYPLIPEGEGDGFVEDGCGSVTEEGVALNIEAVANIAVRVATKVLGCDNFDGNLCIEVNEPLPNVRGIMSNSGRYWFDNRPHSNCIVCSKEVRSGD